MDRHALGVGRPGEQPRRSGASRAGEPVSADADAAPRSRGAFVLIGASVVVFEVWIVAGLGGATAVRYVDDVATAAAALTATLLCAKAAKRRPEGSTAFWWLLAAACAAWTLGELIWALYDLVLGTSVPVPSWADAAYLAAIPLAAGALLAHPAIRGRTIGELRSVLDGLVLATALFFLSWTLLLEPLRQSFDLGSLGKAVTVAYPLGDVVIVFLVVLVIRGTTAGGRLDLWCLLCGLLAITLSDASFGYLTQVKHYATGNAIDVGWFAGYLAIALGAHFARPRTDSRQRIDEPSLSSAALIVPFVPLLAALTLATIRLQFGHHLDRTALATVLVLVALFLIRQVLLLIDLWAPGRPRGAPIPDRLLVALGQAAPGEGEDPTRPPPSATR